MENIKIKHKNASLLKRFMPYYKPYIGIFLLDLLCAFGVAVSGLVFPMLVRYILNVCLAAETVAAATTANAEALFGIRYTEKNTERR